MFQAVANLWCSTFFAPEGQAVSPEEYQQALDTLSRNAHFRRLRSEPWFTTAEQRVQDCPVRAFHWELEFPEVFFDVSRQEADASFHRGFDAIIGNPPYDVLAGSELTRELPADRAADVCRFLESFKKLIDTEPVYRPSKRGKNNLYKLFICRALDLLAEGGRFGFIVPMAVLGDDQSAEVRRAMLDAGALTSVDAFPQKDDPNRRVFPEAKLSTTAFTMMRTTNDASRMKPFVSRQHPANRIEEGSPSLALQTDHIPLYDASNQSIVSCSQTDWDLAVRVIGSGRMTRLGEFVEFFQGEVNETVQRRKGTLLPRGGKLVTRGACVCLYSVRKASQGDDMLLDVPRFLQGASQASKAYHHRYPRVVIQESSPQNNFRRIIAAGLDAGEFCNHTINYCPETASTTDSKAVIAVLNSKLADWYFRLGSTNAHVSHYQIYNLPFPVFAATRADSDVTLPGAVDSALDADRFDDVFAALLPALDQPPFQLVVQDVLVELVRRIIEIEEARGDIARTERSQLADAAQPLQDLIDHLLYAMAGMTEGEAAGLEERLSRML
jgi:hypothetical protein